MKKNDFPKLVTHGEIKPGDIGFARTTGFLGFLIRVGELLKWRNGIWNHVFVVVSTGDLGNEIIIAQATLRGVVISPLKELMDKSIGIRIIPCPAPKPEKVVEFSMAQKGKPYGLGSILCIGLDILTPDWFVSFRRNGTWICSAVSGEALRYGGLYFDWKDIYTVTPTQLWLQVKP